MNQLLLLNHIDEPLYHRHRYDRVKDKTHKSSAGSANIFSTSIIPNHHITEDDISDSCSVSSSDVSLDSIADIPVKTNVSLVGIFTLDPVDLSRFINLILIVVVVVFAKEGIILSLRE